MNAAQRRECILTRLNSAGAPLSASTLAAELGVSRQIVVGDVALLRAGGAQIDATPRGYQLHPAEKGYTGILACVHRTQEEMRREDFGRLILAGVEPRTAYETVHGRELMEKAMRYAAGRTRRQVAGSLASGMGRVAENGGRSIAVTASDPRGLTSEDLADIRRRVLDGEKIRF